MCTATCKSSAADLRGGELCWPECAEGPGGAVCFGLFAGDGLLECSYCAEDHFTTLRVHEKKLFTSTWAQAGITGSVLTGCHHLF